MPDGVPSISFVVPTAGRDTITRCLRSIAPQLLPHDEVIVIGDVYDNSLPETELAVRRFNDSFEASFRYIEFAGTGHDWGHSQANRGFTVARGDLIHLNDDDDVWTPEAARAIREAAMEAPGSPLLFRFISMFGLIYWPIRGYVARDYLGGHCLVQPNIPDRIGFMAPLYTGDFDMIEECLTRHGGRHTAVWRQEIIAHARPGGIR